MRVFEGRLDEPWLSVPGVIGVLLGRYTRHMLLGQDAGWPRGNAGWMGDWKRNVWLVEQHALTAELRAMPGRSLAAPYTAADIAELRQQNIDWYDPPRDDLELDLRRAARLLEVSLAEAEQLHARGVGVFMAGYSRHTDSLHVARWGHTEKVRGWIWEHGVDHAIDGVEAPADVTPERRYDLLRDRWMDRALRAFTDGVISEPAVQCAHWTTGPLLSDFRLIEDDTYRAALDVAARMAAGADEVDVPLLGRAVRVGLPAFELVWHEGTPYDGLPAKPRHTLVVPPETIWLLDAPR